MQAIQSVHLAYFSGTGGTTRVAEEFEKAFIKKGVAVRKSELVRNAPVVHDEDLLVLLFAVYALRAPKPVDEWIKLAPPGNGRPAAVISVSGGGEISPNTNCRAAVIRQLELKGYDVLYESMFTMPCNFLIRYDDAVCAMLIKAAPRKANRIVSDILAGERCRKKPLLFDRFLSTIGLLEKRHSGFFGKSLYATQSCIGCGWCEKHCPRGNIKLINGKPCFGTECVICLRCIYGCPQKAIVPGAAKSFVLQDGFNIEVMEARTAHVTQFPPVDKIAKGPIMAGVRRYLKEELD